MRACVEPKGLFSADRWPVNSKEAPKNIYCKQIGDRKNLAKNGRKEAGKTI
jgi:hypothetical protein